MNTITDEEMRRRPTTRAYSLVILQAGVRRNQPGADNSWQYTGRWNAGSKRTSGTSAATGSPWLRLLRGDITMIKIAQSVTVNRPVAEVWEFISNFENTTIWSRGVLEARQTSEGPIGVGSTLQTVVQAFGRRRTASYLVTEYEPNRTFAFKVTSGVMTSQARYSVEPAGAGTRLTGSGEIDAVGLYKLLAPILVRAVKRHSEDDLANVKRILEAPVAAN